VKGASSSAGIDLVCQGLEARGLEAAIYNIYGQGLHGTTLR